MALTAVAGALLAVAILADGTQPGLTSFGFAVLVAAWFVGLWRAEQRRKYLVTTALVALGCLFVALVPWLLSMPFDPCPKVDGTPADCFEGDVKAFIDGLEPAAIVIALVLGAIAFGTFAAAPATTPIPDTDPEPPPPAEPAAQAQTAE